MPTDSELHARIDAIREPLGNERRTLHVGPWSVGLDGMDRALASELDRRWGPFVVGAGRQQADPILRLLHAGADRWIDEDGYYQRYRLERCGAAERELVLSYNFALRGDGGHARWTLAMTSPTRESAARIVENAVRYVLAVLALDAGGWAMHGGGVVHEGRAYLYTGPSRSGKTSAVAASAPARAIGDDFAIAVPGEQGWLAPALPFDGAEVIAADAPRGTFPVAGIWRLYHAETTCVERPDPRVAVASLLSSAAFPWTYPHRSLELLDHGRSFVAQCRFEHLHFALDADLYVDLLQRTEDD